MTEPVNVCGQRTSVPFCLLGLAALLGFFPLSLPPLLPIPLF